MPDRGGTTGREQVAIRIEDFSQSPSFKFVRVFANPYGLRYPLCASPSPRQIVEESLGQPTVNVTAHVPPNSMARAAQCRAEAAVRRRQRSPSREGHKSGEWIP
jgi:hypothetical protein